MWKLSYCTKRTHEVAIPKTALFDFIGIDVVAQNKYFSLKIVCHPYEFTVFEKTDFILLKSNLMLKWIFVH